MPSCWNDLLAPVSSSLAMLAALLLGFCFRAPPIVDKYELMVTVTLTNGCNGANRCKSRLQTNSSALVF